MAYANTVTVTRKGNEIIVNIAETDAGAADVTDAIDLSVKKFTFLRQKCELVSGTGTTVDPLLARSNTATSGNDVMIENATAKAVIDNAVPGGYACYVSDGKLYHRSGVDAGADNVINTEYYFTVGL